MNPAKRLHEAGFSLALSPAGKLQVSPASSLTPELRRHIQDNRAAIVASLSDAANDPAPPDNPPPPEPTTAGEDAASMARLGALLHGCGLTPGEVQKTALVLIERDRQGLAMGVCSECEKLHGCGPWRCKDTARGFNELAGMPLAKTWLVQLHRCPSLSRYEAQDLGAVG